MLSTLSTAAVLLSALSAVKAQTFTSCNPMLKTCPPDPGLGTTQVTDFTQGASPDWTYATATTMSYGSDGAEFIIQNVNEAPTISSTKYIFFGKVTATIKACAGYGLVSSFILESDDLDEIDWEWLGASNTNVESNFFGKGDTTSYDRAQYHDVATPQDTWHTYTIDWTSEYVKWYIDNALVRTLLYTDPLTHNGHNFPQTPMMVKMGNWVGCANVSDTAKAGTCQWAAPAGGQADFSSNPTYTMYVKDVTIQDYGSGTEYTYGDMSGSFGSIQSSGGSNGTGSSSGVSSAAPSSSPISSSVTASSLSVTTTSLAHSSGTAVVPSVTIGSSGNPSPSESASAGTTANATGSGGSSNSTGSGTGSGSGSGTSKSGASTLTSLVTATAGTGTSAPKTSDTASKTTSSTPVTVPSSSQANSNKEKTKKYGAADFVVIALGLGLGYLVM